MKGQKLVVLTALTIVVIVIATLFSQSRAPQTTIEKETLFPELAGKINDVMRIEIKSSEKRDVILQKMEDGLWVLESADNYPAQFDKIKDVVVSLSQLKILATKTDNPKLYPDLGVEGPETENTSSLLLTLSDQSGATLATLIVGKPRKSSTGSTRPNLYVRKANVKNALLVEGYLQLKPDNNGWYERNVIHIPTSRIQSVNIVKSTGDHLTMNKRSEGDTGFKVIEGKTTSPSVLLTKLGTFFEDMHVEGVHAANNFEFPDDTTITTFKTFNGLVITVKNILSDGKAFAHFSFTTATTSKNAVNEISENNPQAISVEEESRHGNEIMSNWVYEIPEFKFETLDINVAQSPEIIPE